MGIVLTIKNDLVMEADTEIKVTVWRSLVTGVSRVGREDPLLSTCPQSWGGPLTVLSGW